MEEQLRLYFPLLEEGKVWGLVFCSNTTGDADTEANRVLKRLVAEYKDREIKGT